MKIELIEKGESHSGIDVIVLARRRDQIYVCLFTYRMRENKMN